MTRKAYKSEARKIERLYRSGTITRAQRCDALQILVGSVR
jgi:hypothetical protein